MLALPPGCDDAVFTDFSDIFDTVMRKPAQPSLFLLVLFMTALLPAARAQLRQQPDLNLDAATRLAARATDTCRRLGRPVAVAVLDHGGKVILLQRGDGVGPHNLEAGRRKAYTALSTRAPTLDLARNAQAHPDARNLATLPELLLLGGGVPLSAGGQPAGAIGVAGGGNAVNDHACAQAAIAAVPELDQPSQ